MSILSSASKYFAAHKDGMIATSELEESVLSLISNGQVCNSSEEYAEILPDSSWCKPAGDTAQAVFMHEMYQRWNIVSNLEHHFGDALDSVLSIVLQHTLDLTFIERYLRIFHDLDCVVSRVVGHSQGDWGFSIAIKSAAYDVADTDEFISWVLGDVYTVEPEGYLVYGMDNLPTGIKIV